MNAQVVATTPNNVMAFFLSPIAVPLLGGGSSIVCKLWPSVSRDDMPLGVKVIRNMGMAAGDALDWRHLTTGEEDLRAEAEDYRVTFSYVALDIAVVIDATCGNQFRGPLLHFLANQCVQWV